MCEPMTLLAIGSAAAGLYGQQQVADAQAASNDVQYGNALTARSENANQVTLRRGQEAEAAGEKINANNISMREAQATAIARAGPSGLSVDALLGDIGGKGAGYNQSVTANLDRVNLALDSQLTNVNTNAANTINGLKTPQAPDYLGTALKIGGAAYGAYTQPGTTKADPPFKTNPFAGP